MKKGFSLIELLVVIAIIGIVAFIIPSIGIRIIQSFERDAFERGINGVMRSVILDGKTTDYKGGPYRLFNGELKNNQRVINLTGNVKGEGTILRDETGNLKFGISYNGICATKNFNDTKITFTEGPCEIPYLPSIVSYEFMRNVPLNLYLDNSMLSYFQYSPTVEGTDRNQLILGDNPWGQQDILFRAENDPAGQYDGGFFIGSNTNNRIPIDNTKNYRFSVWAKMEGNSGNAYLYNTNLYSSQTSSTITLTYADGTGPTTNPLISSGNYRNEWVLLVGYLNHYGSINEGSLPSIYRVDGTVLSSTQARKMTTDTNFFRLRILRYNASDNYGYFYRPRVDLLDGNEPTIEDLLRGQENSVLYSQENIVGNLSGNIVLDYPFTDFQEPTVNLAPQPDYSNRVYDQVYVGSAWGGDTGNVVYRGSGGPDNLPYKQKTKLTPGTGGVFMDDNRNINIESLKTYTVSGWVRSIPNINTLNGHFLNINRIADNHYITGPAINLTSTWLRHSWTFTAHSTQGGLYQSRNIIYNDEVSPIDIFWSGFQVENKPYSTPFVNGTREGTIQDYSGNENHASLGQTTTPRWVVDRDGSYLFNGTSTFISAGNNPSYHLPKGSISVWVKSNRAYPSDTTSTAFRGIIARTVSGGTGGQSFYIDWMGTNANRTLRASVGDASSANTISVSNVVLNNDWNHIVFTWSGTKLQLYLNGSKIGEINQTVVVQNLSTNLEIGRVFNGNAYIWDGHIDDVKIYNRPLSQNEVNHLFQNN
jgi:prepilin-type N-terminal cleavage/methylation domain-containing protein